MSNIYELTREYNDLYDLALESADEETGELDSALSSALEIKSSEIEKKGVNIACVVKRFENTIDDIDCEIARLQKMKKQAQTAVLRLKDGLSAAMISCGIEKIQGVKANISFRRSDAVIVDNEADLSDDYMVVKTTISADKAAIKAAIKAGKIVDGAHLETRQYIQIK